MKDEHNSPWGARIERGKVTEAEGGTYTVESYDRPGVTGYGLTGPSAIAAGEKVYFFLFGDGKGLILAKAE